MESITKQRKENSFLMVRCLLADEVILNMRMQKHYVSIGVSFEGSQLEKEFIKIDTRYRNENHLNKIIPNRNKN